MRVPGVIAVNFGGAADRLILDEGQPATANKRAEMWASMRTWLKTGGIPNDPELQAVAEAAVNEATKGVQDRQGHPGRQRRLRVDPDRRGLLPYDIAD
jgi:hypothetical protein